MALQKEGKPMTAIDITKKIKNSIKLSGKTPDATIRCVLQRSSYVESIGNGRWKLKPGSKIIYL